MFSLVCHSVLCAVAVGIAHQADELERIASAPVVQAERMFAERHKAVPLKQAFLEFSDPDGIALTPSGVKNIKEELQSWPEGRGPGVIEWWPEFAGIAASGDVGFTTGPAVYEGGKAAGHYFTIWKRQPDGKWLWLIDFGTRPRASNGILPTPVAVEEAHLSDVAPVQSSGAWEVLRSLDAELGQELEARPFAFVERLAPRGRMMGFFPGVATGERAARIASAGRPAGMRTKLAGGGVSAAGDLGWTYGHVQWSQPDKRAAAGYLRVWQRQKEGWVLLVENISPL